MVFGATLSFRLRGGDGRGDARYSFAMLPVLDNMFATPACALMMKETLVRER